MRKISVFLTLVLVFLMFGFRECDANVSEISKTLGNFFEKRESYQSVIIKIANYTDWKIFCIVICGDETISENIGPGEFLHCQIKNLHNYDFLIYYRVKIVILASDYQGKLMASASKELRINFFSPSPKEETLIILSGGSKNLQIKEGY